jgi:hypothetical protein
MPIAYGDFQPSTDPKVQSDEFEMRIRALREARARRAKATGQDLINPDEQQFIANAALSRLREGDRGRPLSQQEYQGRVAQANSEASRWAMDEIAKRREAMSMLSPEEQQSVRTKHVFGGGSVMGNGKMIYSGPQEANYGIDTVAVKRLAEAARLREENARSQQESSQRIAEAAALQDIATKGAVARADAAAKLKQQDPEHQALLAKNAEDAAARAAAQAERERVKNAINDIVANTSDPEVKKYAASIPLLPLEKQAEALMQVQQQGRQRVDAQRQAQITANKAALTNDDPLDDGPAADWLQKNAPDEIAGVNLKPTYSVDSVLASNSQAGRQAKAMRDRLVAAADKYTGPLDVSRDRSPYLAEVERYRKALEYMGISPEEVDQHIRSLDLPIGKPGMLKAGASTLLSFLPPVAIGNALFGED